MSILEFSTSLQSEEDVQIIAGMLDVHKKNSRWNVAMEDWENILGLEITSVRFMNEIAAGIRGLECEELED